MWQWDSDLPGTCLPRGRMPDERPILILTASAGAGHTIAARAVKAALTAQAPSQRVELHDVLVSAGPLFRAIYGGGYLGIVRSWPAAMGWLYDRMDRPRGTGPDRLRQGVQRLFSRAIVREILRRQPKLVINTHFLPAEIVAELRRAGRWTGPQITVTTDFETHRLWVQEPTERYYTATELGKAYLARCGAPLERISVAGIPVRLDFEQPLNRAAARKSLGLQPDRPVVLLLSSAGGVTPAETLLRELIEMPADAQIVAIAGHYAKLRKRLQAQVSMANRPVFLIGFSDRMHEWMRAADIVVSKPGGLTVAEALVCGVPLVVVNPIPGQETRNSDYLLEHGAALKVNNARLLGYRVSQLLKAPRRLAAMRKATAALAKPGAAATIAADALALLDEHRGLTNADARKESITAGVAADPAVDGAS